jgi:antitoxin Phd
VDWQLAEAKNRFSELVTQALTLGPQRVSRRNQAVIVLSESEYERLKGARKDFVDFLLEGPSLSALDLTRSDEEPRSFVI